MRRSSQTAGFLPQALALATLALLTLGGAARADEAPEAYVIKVDRMITEALGKAVQRKIQAADRQGVRTIIIELDTPGGELGASRNLADYIFSRDDLNIVAYINKDALSGGTMVALACKAIYIDARLGLMGDVAPVGVTGEIIGEKVQSPVRETMLRYARARGYSEALVKAMVTKEVEVFRAQMQDEPEGSYTYITGQDLDFMPEEERAKVVSRTLAVESGQLLTMDAEKAVAYGFARQAVADPKALYAALDIAPDRVERLYLTGSERVLTFLDMFSPLLIAAGIVLVFIEISHPGFGLPGILGISCFAAFFLVKWTLNYARMLEVLLFVIGLTLLIIEIFFIPGFGIVGAAGILLLFVSLVLAFQQFGWPGTPAQTVEFQRNLLKVMGSLLIAGVGIGMLVRYLPSLPVLGRLVLWHDLAAAHAGEGQERRTPGLAGMIGQVGVALTPLRPAGRAEFGQEPLDVVTEGDFIEKGVRVQIREVRGSRIVVVPHREA